MPNEIPEDRKSYPLDQPEAPQHLEREDLKQPVADQAEKAPIENYKVLQHTASGAKVSYHLGEKYNLEKEAARVELSFDSEKKTASIVDYRVSDFARGSEAGIGALKYAESLAAEWGLKQVKFDMQETQFSMLSAGERRSVISDLQRAGYDVRYSARIGGKKVWFNQSEEPERKILNEPLEVKATKTLRSKYPEMLEQLKRQPPVFDETKSRTVMDDNLPETASRPMPEKPELPAPPEKPVPEKPYDTSNEWWNQRERSDESQEPVKDRVKRYAAAGVASALVLASTVFAGREALQEQSSARLPSWQQGETYQSLEVSRPETTFGDLLKNGESAEIEEVEQPDQTVAIEIQPTTESQAQQWYDDVPVDSQVGLKYKGERTGYGCVPTSVSMVTEYWNKENAENKTMSAQELLDTNAKQDQFHSWGMSVSNTSDELSNLGYSTESRANATKDDLKQSLQDGPVVAIVKVNMDTTGYNHAVVVSGISENDEVRVNDPLTGKSHTYEWETFSKSWGANMGRGSSRNYYMTISPN
jgi:predicted double-glycine peptidase